MMDTYIILKSNWKVTLWQFNSLQLKMAIEIVDFPIEHGGSFHSYVNVYQMVGSLNPIKSH